MIDEDHKIVQPADLARAATAPSVALGGLFKRKEVWTLSLRGWLAASLVAATIAAVVFLGGQPFLAITDRVDASVLVVEGWLPDYALLDGWKEFQAEHDRLLLVTGGRGRNGPGMDLNDTYAGWGAERLQKMVGQHEEIMAVPAFEVRRDRTYGSAVALRNWLQSHHENIQAVNVVTLSAHARRSRLLYQEALGPDVVVGVIAVANQDYDARRWWKYSEGVKEMISESAGYLYVRIFFHPGS
ncbi:MAG: ElyC/SanA/YdcF family protein [Limisphaerales bacterium]